MTARVGIIGGTGYGGMELLRWLLPRDDVEVVGITSRSTTAPVGDVHPHLRGLTTLAFADVAPEKLARDVDVLVFAAPHGVAAGAVGAVFDAAPDVRVIDLSGDFRLEDPAAYPVHYGWQHPAPGLLDLAVYGAPECGARAAIRDARLVANPGCHALATLLATWPVVRAGLVTGRLSVCSVTGSSGSGGTPKAGTHHPERFGDFRAYRPLEHQHVPEIVQALGGGSAPQLDFVPHSAPFSRGIHVTAFVPVATGTEDEAAASFADAYAEAPFVRLLPTGTPQVRAVAGSNFADLGLTRGQGVLCVTAAIDNLGKGMAGTAVQNLNLMLGLGESAGLARPGAGL